MQDYTWFSARRYKMNRHESINNYNDFVEEKFQEIVPVVERNLPLEMQMVVWNRKAIVEHNYTMACLLPGRNSSNSGSEIIIKLMS